MRRLLPAIAVLVAACSSSSTTDPGPTSTTLPAGTLAQPTAPATTTDSTTGEVAASSTTTVPAPPEELLYDHWQGSFRYGEDLRIDVHAPDERSNHPIAVTIHGGGWYGGRLDSMGRLADGLAERGFVVFNATYRTLARGGAFPTMVEDVACAVAYARRHALDYSTSADHITVVGHSAGAHLGSLVAFSPATFATSCPEAGAGVDAFVGLAGSYDTDVYAVLLEPFYGSALHEDPEPWMRGNPYTYVGEVDPSLEVLLIHGDVDQLVPVSMSENLFLALDAAGVDATLRIVEGAGHGEVNSPRVVGDLISQFVLDDQ